MPHIKNWDNKTWLSSRGYINSFNSFLKKNIQLNSESKILDITSIESHKIMLSLSNFSIFAILKDWCIFAV